MPDDENIKPINKGEIPVVGFSGSGPHFPPPNMPTIYVDAIWNIARGPGIVKMYLAKNDLDMAGSQVSRINPFAQLVMPAHAFAAAAIFFNRELQVMIKNGNIAEDDVKEIQEAFAQQDKANAKPDQ